MAMFYKVDELSWSDLLAVVQLLDSKGANEVHVLAWRKAVDAEITRRWSTHPEKAPVDSNAGAW